MVALVAALLAVTAPSSDRLPANSVWIDVGVIATAPGCFVCQMVLRTRRDNDILAMQELTIEGNQKTVLDWYERQGGARIRYRLSCEIEAGEEWAVISVRFDARKRGHPLSQSGSYFTRVRIVRAHAPQITLPLN